MATNIANYTYSDRLIFFLEKTFDKNWTFSLSFFFQVKVVVSWQMKLCLSYGGCMRDFSSEPPFCFVCSISAFYRVLKDLFITVKINDIKGIPKRLVFIAVPPCGDCHHCRPVSVLCFLWMGSCFASCTFAQSMKMSEKYTALVSIIVWLLLYL